MTPIIGVTGCYLVSPSPLFHTVERYFINKSYLTAIRLNGGLPLPIPVLEDTEHMKTYLDMCDALLLPGGGDVDPMFFGEDPHRELGIVMPEIDKYEISILQLAFERKMPILGICRGVQVINIAKGGTIFQDIHECSGKKTILHQQQYHSNIGIHRIIIEEDSLLCEILGSAELRVNSMHHQAINEPGKDMVVTATAPDGIIEAIESKDRSIIGVQWHPELMIHSHSEMNKLFKYFIQNMADRYSRGDGAAQENSLRHAKRGAATSSPECSGDSFPAKRGVRGETPFS